MKFVFNKKRLIILTIILFLTNNLAFAQEATLTGLVVDNSSDDLLLSFKVEGAFREKMEKAIMSGVPATFSFFITLDRKRRIWFDKEIADFSFTHSITYNNLKKEYTVTRSWNGNKPVVTQSFVEAKKLMINIDGLKVVPLNKLTKGKQYEIQAKAELSKLTLPLYLHYILFFVSLWDFETEWYTIDFPF